MRWTREQYIDLMTFAGSPPRQMFVELFGLLVGLEQQWRRQGAAEAEISLHAFDFDHVDRVFCGGATHRWGVQPAVVLEETDEYVLQRDDLGRRIKLCKGAATIPLPLDYPVATMDDWLEIKPRYQFRPERIDAARIDRAKAEQAAGALVVASIPGCFSEPRQLMGDEAVCLAYYDQPELIHDMLGTFGDTALKVLQRVTDEVTIDQLSVHEDLAGKSGPLLGPRQVEQFVRPYFRPVWQLVSGRGTRMFRMDTDGNVNAVIEAFLDCGVTEIYPMEPAAGMDIVELRRAHGRRLAMSGGIDKHVVRRSAADIRRELEYKMQPLMQQGGTIFALDHRIPNGTPLANYRYYVDTAREILALPPRGDGGTWKRMAF